MSRIICLICYVVTVNELQTMVGLPFAGNASLCLIFRLTRTSCILRWKTVLRNRIRPFEKYGFGTKSGTFLESTFYSPLPYPPCGILLKNARNSRA